MLMHQEENNQLTPKTGTHVFMRKRWEAILKIFCFFVCMNTKCNHILNQGMAPPMYIF